MQNNGQIADLSSHAYISNLNANANWIYGALTSHKY